MAELVEIADELRRLASCGDIPSYRRRQLLSIAEQLVPTKWADPATSDLYVDPYYRRGGMRLRLPAQDKPPPGRPPMGMLRLTAPEPTS